MPPVLWPFPGSGITTCMLACKMYACNKHQLELAWDSAMALKIWYIYILHQTSQQESISRANASNTMSFWRDLLAPGPRVTSAISGHKQGCMHVHACLSRMQEWCACFAFATAPRAPEPVFTGGGGGFGVHGAGGIIGFGGGRGKRAGQLGSGFGLFGGVFGRTGWDVWDGSSSEGGLGTCAGISRVPILYFIHTLRYNSSSLPLYCLNVPSTSTGLSRAVWSILA